MRILYISNPNSTHTRRWVDWFHQHGHTVRVIADVSLQEAWPGIPVDDLPVNISGKLPGVLKYLLWTLATRRILREFAPDILHAHRVTSAGWIGVFSGFHPMVVTPWGSDLYQFPQRSRLAEWLTRQVLQQADLVTADAQDLRKLAIHYGADPRHTHFVHWGVDPDLFRPSENQAELRQKMGWQGQPILYCPRAMHPIYNLDILLEALPTIRRNYPGVLLILRDYNTNLNYRSRLMQMINEKALQDCVKIIPGLPWPETVALYQAADLVISAPSSDSTPVSLLEAMACGTPVIATDLPAIQEWIQPGKNGVLVPVRDAPGLAQAVIALWSQPELQQQFSQVNLALVQERANHQSEMSRVEALYQSLLDGQPATNPTGD